MHNPTTTKLQPQGTHLLFRMIILDTDIVSASNVFRSATVAPQSARRTAIIRFASIVRTTRIRNATFVVQITRIPRLAIVVGITRILFTQFIASCDHGITIVNIRRASRTFINIIFNALTFVRRRKSIKTRIF